ncbi:MULTISPECIES: globin domain-containing protein [Rhodomicrobium]|uniref:globin domain-containing protein n=1 Tax=Rhodomicrobium TaxID=1068 RepID=UPI000B4BC37E|nr:MULTISPECIES: globin domain-containing protein [Rhodomicrobium]
MTPRQIRLVQRSFALIEPYADQVGTSFYAKLGELAPDIRPALQSDLEASKRKLMKFLGEFVKLQLRSLLTMPVTGARELEIAIPGVAELVADHAQLGLGSDDFGLGKEALLASIAEQLGDQFDEPTAAAWTAAFDMISDSMIRVMRGEAPVAAELETAGAARIETDARALESLYRH